MLGLGLHRYQLDRERTCATLIFEMTLEVDQLAQICLLKRSQRSLKVASVLSKVGQVPGQEIHLWVEETSCKISSAPHPLLLKWEIT